MLWLIYCTLLQLCFEPKEATSAFLPQPGITMWRGKTNDFAWIISKIDVESMCIKILKARRWTVHYEVALLTIQVDWIQITYTWNSYQEEHVSFHIYLGWYAQKGRTVPVYVHPSGSSPLDTDSSGQWNTLCGLALSFLLSETNLKPLARSALRKFLFHTDASPWACPFPLTSAQACKVHACVHQ